jgi:hypothetical protein
VIGSRLNEKNYKQSFNAAHAAVCHRRGHYRGDLLGLLLWEICTMNWAIEAEKLLKGKTIESVRYLSQKECEEMDWHRSPPVIFLSDGSWIMPARDDEGNDGGALFTSDDDLPVIPVNGGDE